MFDNWLSHIYVWQIIRENSYIEFYSNPTSTSCTHTCAWKRRPPYTGRSSYTSWWRAKNQEPNLRQQHLPHRQHKPGRCHSHTHIKHITPYNAQSQLVPVWARACVRVCDTSVSECEEREREKKTARCNITCLLLTSVSTCLGHHYAHLQENKDGVTAYGVLLWFCWMWLVAVVGRCVVGCEQRSRCNN